MKTHSAITRDLTVGFQYKHRCTNTFKYEFSYQHFQVWVTGKANEAMSQSGKYDWSLINIVNSFNVRLVKINSFPTIS